MIMKAIIELYERIVNKHLSIRRIYIVATNVINESIAKKEIKKEQIDLFTNYQLKNEKRKEEEKQEGEEKKLQHTIIDLKRKFGKNIILKGINLEEGSTMIERNNQIGGHKA